MKTKYLGYTIEVVQDEDPINCRTDYDHLGTMVCFHNGYSLGDKHEFESPKDVKEHIKATKAVSLPMYLYDHSGLTVNTTGFSCQWDSGQIGYIFIERDKLLKEFGGKVLTKKLRERALEILRAEVKEYDDYLTGEVYGFTVKDAKGQEVHSCWGFYGDPDKSGILDEAKSEALYEYKQRAQKHVAKLKAWIKNKVTLQARRSFCPA